MSQPERSGAGGLLFIKQTDVMGGGERHLLHLLDWAVAAERPVWLATNYPPLEKMATKTGATLVDSPMIPEAVALSRLPQFLLMSHRIRAFWSRRLRDLAAQGLEWVVVDGINHKLIVTPVARQLGLKIVWLEHLLWTPDLTANPLNPIDRWLVRSSSGANAVIVFSSASRTELKGLGIAPRQLILWRHGVVSPPTQPPLPAPRSNIIGTIGRLHRQKGLGLLVTILREFPELRLEIIGSGPDRAWFQEELKLAGVATRVHIFDYSEAVVRERLPEWDVFVFPTLVDNAPIAILEGMSYARPILANRVGGIEELVDHQGWLISPSQPAAFLATLKKILSDDPAREKMGSGAYHRARDYYSLRQEESQFDAFFGGNHGQGQASGESDASPT